MQTSVPELMDLSKEPRSDLRALRPRFAQARHLRRQLPAGAPAGRARRALRPALSSRLGPAQRPAARSRAAVPGDRPADSRARSRISSSAACSTTRWSSGAASSAARSISQGKLTDANYGRDHHPRCFTMWLAGGGIKPGIVLGETDDFCYNIVTDPVSRPRPAGDDPALPGHRPQAADLQVPGPRLPADRRARRGRAEAAGLSGDG